MYKKIEIVMLNGTIIEYDEAQWDDYRYDGKFFSIIKDNANVAMYNCNAVRSLRLLK